MAIHEQVFEQFEQRHGALPERGDTIRWESRDGSSGVGDVEYVWWCLDTAAVRVSDGPTHVQLFPELGDVWARF